MDYSKYYTPVKIAELLISLIDLKKPKTTIDICCGSCNLLYAAKKKWPKTNLIGVDIIHHNSNDVQLFKSDGRKFAINQKQKYPLILANPPFSILKKNINYSLLYKNDFKEYDTSRLEIEMMLANLYLLKKNGLLVIILPNTFVESERNKLVRTLLAKKYHINKIIKLPDDTFGSAKIKSYALFISKNILCHKITKYYEVFTSNNNLSISKGKIIKQKNIRCGQWLYNNNINILGIEIKRGNISSQMFCKKGIRVLHTSKQNNYWIPSTRYIKKKPKNPIYVKFGDILISRIGKSAGQWTVYMGEKTIISDCLFCLKDDSGQIYKKIRDRRYNNIIRGVATPYITIKDFISWI